MTTPTSNMKGSHIELKKEEEGYNLSERDRVVIENVSLFLELFSFFSACFVSLFFFLFFFLSQR